MSIRSTDAARVPIGSGAVTNRVGSMYGNALTFNSAWLRPLVKVNGAASTTKDIYTTVKMEITTIHEEDRICSVQVEPVIYDNSHRTHPMYTAQTKFYEYQKYEKTLQTQVDDITFKFKEWLYEHLSEPFNGKQFEVISERPNYSISKIQIEMDRIKRRKTCTEEADGCMNNILLCLLYSDQNQIDSNSYDMQLTVPYRIEGHPDPSKKNIIYMYATAKLTIDGYTT